MSGFNPKWIIGRKVVRVEMNAFDNAPYGQAHNPRIYFDNGASIAFVTEELESGSDYGTAIVYSPPGASPEQDPSDV